MKTLLTSILFLSLLIPTTLFSQTTVEGTVTDQESGLPVPGVNILIKGTTTGAVTDFDGNYSLNVSEGDILVFSYIGFKTQEIPFTGQARVDVSLTEDSAELDEVVIIGYGSTNKQDATGAVEKVSDEEFNRGAIVAPQQLIAGKAAGVRITSGGGAAGEGGEIRIRGGASLSATNDPLIVIDGLPIDQRGGSQGSRNALNAINPADIEDFVVLKDASATAIYGSRASNGVILITTKKGSANQPLKVEYGLQASVRTVANKIDVLSADQFRSIANSNGIDSDEYGTGNTDWQDVIYKPAIGAIHNLTVSKGFERSNFRVNFNHVSQQGPLQTDLYERNGINLSYVQRLLDNDLKLTLVSKGIKDEYSYANQGAIGSAIRFDPTRPVFDQSGAYYQYGPDANLAPANPLFLLKENQDRQSIKRFISNFNVDYRFWFLEDLKFNLNLGIDYAENDGARYNAANPNNPDAFRTTAFSEGLNRNTSMDMYLNYKSNLKSINTELDLTAGYAYQEFYIRSMIDQQTGPVELMDTDINRNALESVFARASFDINNRYLLLASIRADGSSRFSENNRWGIFPGVSVGWKLSNEEFLQDSFFSDLKLRAGWGVTGQQEIGQNYGYLGLYTPSRNEAANIQFGTQANGEPIFINTLRPQGFDENLKWEETDQFNVALDFGFFNNRLSGTIDAYYRETKDLLSTVPTAAGSNLTDLLLTNVGEVTSRGLELTLNGKIAENDKFTWNSNFNLTFQDQEITNLSLNDDPNYFIQTGGISGGVGNLIQILRPGYDPSTFFVFRQVYDEAGNAIEGAYVDVNGDNVITEADRQPYKKATPDAFMGFTNNFTYNNFDLNFTFRGNFGNYVYNNNASETGNLNAIINQPGYIANANADVLNTGFVGQELFSDYYIERADFVRLDNISLGYTFPMEKMTFRASLTGTNLFVITEYDGLDPEIPSGIDNNAYPRTRDIVLGLNLTF